MVDRGGQMIWANAKLQSYAPKIIEAIRVACAEMCEAFADEPTTADPVRVRGRTIDVDQEQFFDLTVSARANEAGQVEQVVALAWDLTETKQLQAKINAIDAAGHQLISLDTESLTKMDVEDRLQALEDGIVSCCHDLLHFDNFAIRVLDKRSNRLDTILATGLSEEGQSRLGPGNDRGERDHGLRGRDRRAVPLPRYHEGPALFAGIAQRALVTFRPAEAARRSDRVFNIESEGAGSFYGC